MGAEMKDRWKYRIERPPDAKLEAKFENVNLEFERSFQTVLRWLKLRADYDAAMNRMNKLIVQCKLDGESGGIQKSI